VDHIAAGGVCHRFSCAADRRQRRPASVDATDAAVALGVVLMIAPVQKG
jgi:hypothetical protein